PEGGVIPVAQPSLTAAQLGPPTKLAIIATMSREIAEHSAESGEAVVTMILQDAARAALDNSLFSNTAGSASQPAGLLAGISATTASTATDGYAACLSDTRALTDAVVAGGGSGGPSVLYFCSPGRKIALDGYLPGLAGRTFGSAWIAAGELIAVDSAAFASG